MPPRALSLALLLLLATFLWRPAGSALAQPPDDADEAPPPAAATLISPVAAPWTLLVNLGESAAPAELLASLRPWADAAFSFDAASGRFRTFRFDRPALSDLTRIGSGEAFWLFLPPERLEGDLTFWEQDARVRDGAVDLRPGFNLVAWTGSDGVPISVALGALPVRRAALWDAVAQRFAIWNPDLPPALRDDFVLEYGVGLWVDLAGSAAVLWEQR